MVYSLGAHYYSNSCHHASLLKIYNKTGSLFLGLGYSNSQSDICFYQSGNNTMKPGAHNNINDSQKHPLIPLGLFISSTLCKELFGKFSKEDFKQLLASVQRCIVNPKNEATNVLQLVKADIPKLIGPTLYLTSLIIALQNSEKSKQYHRFLKQHVERIDDKTTAMEKEIHDTHGMIKEMVKKIRYSNL